MPMDQWYEMALNFLMTNEENATVETVRLLAGLLKSVDENARADVRAPRAAESRG
jgi:hypothetical protein